MSKSEKALVTGATGYVGGRLLLSLKEAGYPVRCLVRRPQDLQTGLPDLNLICGKSLIILFNRWHGSNFYSYNLQDYRLQGRTGGRSGY